jgi:phage tail protein X
LHTIQRGDTLFGLAKQQYGDAAKIHRIVEVNPFLSGLAGHQQLPVGTMILLP